MNKFYNKTFTFRFFLVILIFLFGENVFSQTGITGKVIDEDTRDEMIAANVIVSKNGVFVQGETTDIDGNYKIRLDPGIYEVEVSYTGYPTKKLADIVVNAGELKKLDVKMKIEDGIIYCYFGYEGYLIPLIKHDETSTGQTLRDEKIKNLPTRNINEIITITPGVSLTQ